MFGPYSHSAAPVLPGGWIEKDHVRLDVNAVEAENPVRQFFRYYRSLADPGLPRWRQFDICAVPPNVVSHIALGRPEYRRGETRSPIHFVYTLQGGAIRMLTGLSMVGETIGRVPGFTRSSRVHEEIADAVDGGDAVCSRFDLATRFSPELKITRGLFPFAGDDRPIERLVVVLSRAAHGS